MYVITPAPRSAALYWARANAQRDNGQPKECQEIAQSVAYVAFITHCAVLRSGSQSGMVPGRWKPSREMVIVPAYSPRSGELPRSGFQALLSGQPGLGRESRVRVSAINFA